MTPLVVAVLVVAGAGLFAFGLWLGRQRSASRPIDGGASSGVPADAPSGEAVEPGTDLVVRDADDGALELWWPGGGRLATLRPGEGGGGTSVGVPWLRRAVTPLAKRAVGRYGPGRSQRYRITFPTDLIEAMQAGGGSLDAAAMGAGALPAAGSRLGVLGAGTPLLAVAAGAVALSVAQQQRLDRTLAAIESRIDLVLDRMRDDDHGRLDAAESLLAQLELSADGVVPDQLRRELAASRHTVEAIYHARHRFAERLGEAIGAAQTDAENSSGEAQAWADGVLDAVGDPSQLRSELFVYLRALVLRARVATATAGVLAVDGDVLAADRLLRSTVEDLRHDFYAIFRRVKPLAQWAPKRGLSRRRKEWMRAHATVIEVHELMAAEVEPLLPDDQPSPVEIEAVVDDDGEVTDLVFPD